MQLPDLALLRVAPKNAPAAATAAPRHVQDLVISTTGLSPRLRLQLALTLQNTASQIPSSPSANPNPEWTSTPCTLPNQLNCTTSVANNWTQASTNPISTWTGCVTDRTQTSIPEVMRRRQQHQKSDDAAQENEYYKNSTAYCNPNSSTSPLEPIMPLTYYLEHAEAARQRDAADGRHQSGHRARLGMADASDDRSRWPAPAEDFQHHLQPGDHHPVRRSQHRGSLARLRQWQLAKF